MGQIRRMPAGFADDARRMTQRELMRKYHTGPVVLSRWLDELDFHPGRGKRKRPVAQYDPDTGELIAVWPFISAAGHVMYGRDDINTSSICQCCRGRVETAVGWAWEYYEEEWI